MKKIDLIAAVLVAIGGLNWGLVALANFDLVAAISGAGGFGEKNALGTLVYALVGVAALYQATMWRQVQRRWQVARG